ncbi:MAG: MBL fold metallo-hydrolase [candidate division NC10 bacterium]
MNESNLHQVFRRTGAQGLIRAPLFVSALMLTLCLTAIGGCTGRPDPLQKAFDAAGGQEALLELRDFGYESAGERFETGQGLNPEAGAIRSSSFDLSVLYDVENDRLSFDWRREIFHPARGALAYKDVIDGDLGHQTGNASVFNPPEAFTSRALPSEYNAAVRREFRLLNPLLYLRTAAMTEGAATIKADVEHDGRTYHVIEVADPSYPVKLIVDTESGRVVMLKTLQNDYIWGDVEIEVSYGDWSSPDGSPLLFPHRVDLALSGQTLLTESRTNLVVNPEFATDAFALPEEPRTQVDAAAAQRGALSAQYHTRWHALGIAADQDQTVVTAAAVAGDPEVQHLTGGTHHSLAIRLGDGIVVIEPPLNEVRSKAVLAKVEELWPGVPVTHLILTHHHFDHMGGIRTYAAAGATIVTSALNRAYVEAALSTPHTLVADELARVESPEWHIEAVAPDAEFSLEGGGRTVKARHIPTVHNEDMLVIYLPELRLIFESDIYVMPGGFPAHQPLPAPFAEWARGLRDGLAALDWEIEWIAGGHGGVAPFADLLSHFES